MPHPYKHFHNKSLQRKTGHKNDGVNASWFCLCSLFQQDPKKGKMKEASYLFCLTAFKGNI